MKITQVIKDEIKKYLIKILEHYQDQVMRQEVAHEEFQHAVGCLLPTRRRTHQQEIQLAFH